MRRLLLALFIAAACATSQTQPQSSAGRKPNILFWLMDDLDYVLGSWKVMSNLQALLIEQGVSFTNAFVTTPVCCPSRGSLLTGQFQHNSHVFNNSDSGGCGQSFSAKEPETMGLAMQQQGYNTALFGKYLNGYWNSSHIPVGWDRWYGLLGSSVYYNYGISDQGTLRLYNATYPGDYFPLVLRSAVMSYLTTSLQNKSTPFFAYISPPAPHRVADFEPAFADVFSGWVAPRTPAFNVSSPDKHWLIRQGPPINSTIEQLIDNLYRARLRTLLTIDYWIADVVALLQEYDELDNTYIIFTSDNGYHLGEFRMQGEKRELYETDIRVPLVVRGPGIPPNTTTDALAVLIDIMPTLIDMAGGPPSPTVDGQSLVPVLKDPHTAPTGWRHDFLIEYHGEAGEGSNIPNPLGCFVGGGNLTGGQSPSLYDVPFYHDCHNNTYVALRVLNSTMDLIYANFTMTGEQEFYALNTDQFQLNNVVNKVPAAAMSALWARIDAYRACAGASCRALSRTPLTDVTDDDVAFV